MCYCVPVGFIYDNPGADLDLYSICDDVICCCNKFQGVMVLG